MKQKKANLNDKPF